MFLYLHVLNALLQVREKNPFQLIGLRGCGADHEFVSVLHPKACVLISYGGKARISYREIESSCVHNELWKQDDSISFFCFRRCYDVFFMQA